MASIFCILGDITLVGGFWPLGDPPDRLVSLLVALDLLPHIDESETRTRSLRVRRHFRCIEGRDSMTHDFECPDHFRPAFVATAMFFLLVLRSTLVGVLCTAATSDRL